MADNRRMPSAKAIRDHWWQKLVEMGRFDTKEEVFEGDYCFACGQEWPSKTERAHICPRYLGGSDDPSNLHMLCADCHQASESMVSYDEYWAWFEQRTLFDALAQAYFNGGGRLKTAFKE